MERTGSGWAELARRIGIVLAAFWPATSDAITLASVFSDHVILQRDQPLPVWGRATKGESVTVTFGGQAAMTTAQSDGRWIVVLKPLVASDRPAELIVKGDETLTVRDVLVGDVWLVSGQSNMAWPVSRAQAADAEIAAADFPSIRELHVDGVVAGTPADAVSTSGWRAATSATVGDFSAVGYFFAREMHRATSVPIGIINCSYGGTSIEAWMSDEARGSTAIAAKLNDRWAQAKKLWPPERVAAYHAEHAAWQEAETRARATETRNPLPWPPPPATDDSPARPGGLFNGMVAPLQPVALRGVLWYQAEGNDEHPEEYAELFTTLIRSWRDGWKQSELPFYFVQLPNHTIERDWAALRQAQAAALTLSATGMAVTIDIGDPEDIHPKNKQEVGRRLALLARVHLYGEKIACRGPEFSSMTHESAALRVRFEHADGGLVSRGPVQAVEIAGPDNVFVPATAVIEGETLLVSSPNVSQPCAVRYAWSSSPVANLYNAAGLPAAPFQSLVQ